MERMFSYNQNRKTDKGKCIENCSIDIYDYLDHILIELHYDFTYTRPKDQDQEEFQLRRELETEHTIKINLKTGDFHVFSSTINRGFMGTSKSSNRREFKNKFSQLLDITTDSYFKGFKNHKSVVYERNAAKGWEVIKDKIQPLMKNDYLKSKEYHKVECNMLYDLIVDFHIDKKRIKGHDLIYLDILEDYPKQKYLKLNDRKFIPSVLDQYGIKTKQFVSTLSNGVEGMPVILKTLNYFCKLFGENYIDYMNKIDWHLHCYKPPPTNKVHPLKNEREKKNMISVIQNWEKDSLRLESNISGDGSLVTGIYTILDLRDKIEKKGIELKFTATDDGTIDKLYDEWISLKKYLQKGYRLRYSFPEDFVDFIEQPIVIGNVKYNPLILKEEEQFKVEGHIMKNCMGNQFVHGIASIFVSLRKGKKWVNVQYRKGERHMCYAKANSPVPDEFQKIIKVLDKRFKKFKEVKWEKEKYDLIK